MSVPHASLKVFEPLERFEPAERERLLATAVASRPGAIVLSRTHGLDGIAAVDRAETIEESGRSWICPHRSRLRLLSSLLTFQRAIPLEVSEAFMPADEAERAAIELHAIREAHPGWRSHILTSTWEVPVRWFAAFDDSERVLDLEEPSLTYRTTMRLARARTDRALEASRSAMIGPGVTSLISELGRWLSIFDDDSLVELDYGDLARLIDRRELGRDHSAKEIQVAVSALGAGDILKATTYYMRAAERWAPLAGLERNN